MTFLSTIPVLYIVVLTGTVLFCYMIYSWWYVSQDTKLTFNLEDAVCFNPEFHHNFLMRRTEELPALMGSNQLESVMRLTKIQLADRLLNIAIPSGALRLKAQGDDEEICLSSAYDIVLENANSAPYIYGNDVSVSSSGKLLSRMLVARSDIRIRVDQLEADGILASGDIEISSRKTVLTRIAGFAYRFNEQPVPAHAKIAFQYKRYDPETIDREQYVKVASITANKIVTSNIVCARDLEIASGATIHGAVKVYGSVRLGGPVTFLGPVVVNEDFDAPEGCVFMSDVVIKGVLRCNRFFVAGQPHKHSVCVIARRMSLVGVVMGSGTLVASEREYLRHAA